MVLSTQGDKLRELLPSAFVNPLIDNVRHTYLHYRDRWMKEWRYLRSWDDSHGPESNKAKLNANEMMVSMEKRVRQLAASAEHILGCADQGNQTLYHEALQQFIHQLKVRDDHNAGRESN